VPLVADPARRFAATGGSGRSWPDSYEPRVKKRRRNHCGWLTEPHAKIKRKMAKGLTVI
jgi:hypothetical protein